MPRRWLLVAGLVLILLGALGIIARNRFSPTQAGIQIEANPSATVYINGEQVGTTPFEQARAPGEITVRLVPNASNGPLSTWETKLTLTAGINTVVKRDFGQTDALSSGEILSFERVAGNSASLTIVSSPDASQISLDGQIKGFTPIKLDSVSSGDHEIVVSHSGFLERRINARAQPGYRLTVFAKLAQTEEEAELEPKEAEMQETKVEILTTPTGFLRVRKEATTASEELGRVTPGKKYTYLDENEDASWFKIEYEEGKEGWVSAQYVKKIEPSSQ